MALPVRRRQSPDLTRWDPVTDVDRLRSQIETLFDRAADLPDPLADVFVPLADVEETDDAYVIEIELPGVDQKDIDVSVSGRRLLVTGERKERSASACSAAGLAASASSASRSCSPTTSTRTTSMPTSTRACSPCGSARRPLRGAVASR